MLKKMRPTDYRSFNMAVPIPENKIRWYLYIAIGPRVVSFQGDAARVVAQGQISRGIFLIMHLF